MLMEGWDYCVIVKAMETMVGVTTWELQMMSNAHISAQVVANVYVATSLDILRT